MLNYDLHWNPVRLIQRFGRVDRIGTEHEVINLHNMWPDMAVDEELSLTERLHRRIQSFHDLIGLDSKLLSDAERLNASAMYRIYEGKTLPEMDDGLDEVAANQRAITLLQRIQGEDPELWRTITGLPDGIRSALQARTQQPTASNDRYAQSVLAVIQQAYVEGVSTRRVDDLVKALGCEGISKSQVSRICQELDVVVDGFLGRPLDGGPYPYLWLDALTQKVREDGRIVNVSVVVATAVNGEGKREIIGMDVGTSEDGAFWLAFLRSLSARGLSGVELVVSDAHQGLRGAIAAVFGGASWQRCRTHFMTNLLTRVPRRAQPWVATMVRTIYQQPSPDEVHAQLDRVTSQLHDRFPEVASLLDEAGPDVLAFSSFPLAHWKKLWSNNPQERLNKEIRRRTDVVGIFPNRPAVRRLVGAVLAEQHDEWVVGRRYLTPAILTFNEALPEADLAEATTA